MADYEASAELVGKLRKGQQLVVRGINGQGQMVSMALPLDDFAKAYDGPPTDPKVFEAQQKQLQEDLQKRAEAARRKLEAQQAVASPQVSPAPPNPTLAAVPTTPPAIAPVAGTGRRVALVIGNSAYQSVPLLPNPQRDSEFVAGALRRIGFQTVTVANNVTRDKLIDALRLFGRQAEDADWAVVYFAGHGIQIGGTNYLLPIDAKLESDRDVEWEAVSLPQVMNAVDGARKLRLVILDACRDNPFANQMRRSVATRSVGRGLARVEPDVGTLVVYSAKEGEVALDDDGGANSPFAAAFVREMATPGIEIRRLFDLVRDDVMEATRRRQQPFTYGSVSGRENFFFVGAQ
jgi:hypothetical protein